MTGPQAPAVDVAATGAGTVLVADLPGVAPDGLVLRVEGRTLSVSATPADPLATLPGGPPAVRHAEWRPGPLARTFILDAAVDPDRITADLTAGVLTVTLPRRDRPGPRTVAVTAGPPEESR